MTIDVLQAQCTELRSLLEELSDDDWLRPTRCPGWTVRELAVHCEEMMRRLPAYKELVVQGRAEIDRSSYYGYDPDGPREGADPAKTFSEVIRDRVIDEAGARSGDEIRAGVAEATTVMLDGIRDVPADLVIKRDSHRPIAFGELVATRVLEFGVHSMDIGHATLRGERVHPAAVPVITGILEGRLGAPLPLGLGWDPRTYILTGTGRRPLSSNERFVLGTLAEKFPLLA